MTVNGKMWPGATRLQPVTATQWAPTLTVHNPNPPITLESPAAVVPAALPAPAAETATFALFNGWSVAVANATPRRKPVRKGLRTRSYRRQLRDARRFMRRGWDCEAVCLDPDEATTLEHVLLGEGHFVDFAESLHAQTGLGPLAGYGPVQFLPSAWGAFGRGCASFPDVAVGAVLRYDVQALDEWSVHVRIWDYARQLWVGHGIRSDGVGFVNGVADATFGAPLHSSGVYFRVLDGVVELVKDTSAVVLVDDLVMLTYRACDSAMVAWTRPTTTTTKFGPCPALRVSGDLFDNERRLAVGGNVATEVVQKPSRIVGYGWVNSARVVRFTLDEVDARYVRAERPDNDVTPEPPLAPYLWLDADNLDGMHNLLGGVPAEPRNRGSSTSTFQAFGFPVLARYSGASTKIAGAASIVFDGADTVNELGVNAPTGTVTIAVVWLTDSVAAGSKTIVSTADTRFKLRRNAAKPTMDNQANTDAHTSNATALSWNSHIGQFSDTASLHVFNGVSEATAPADFRPIVDDRPVTIGSNAWAGKMAVVLMFDGVVDVAAVEAFLVARYGGGLPFPH